jgi:hypothetical protein
VGEAGVQCAVGLTARGLRAHSLWEHARHIETHTPRVWLQVKPHYAHLLVVGADIVFAVGKRDELAALALALAVPAASASAAASACTSAAFGEAQLDRRLGLGGARVGDVYCVVVPAT